MNISCYIAQLPPFTKIYWGDSNDGQQAITPTNIDQGLGRRYQSVTTKFSSVSHMIWQHNNRLVAIRYSRVSFEIPTRHLHLIAYFVSLRKWLWNYKGLITLCGVTLFECIVLPWLPICQGKDSGLSPRYAPRWCMTMRGTDHAPPPSWAECLTALSNKLHSRQLAEISWKGELYATN